MAYTDREPTLVSNLSSIGETGSGVESTSLGGVEGSLGSTEEKGSSDAVSSTIPATESISAPKKTTSTDVQPTAASTRPILVQLGSGSAHGASTSTPIAPHPKKFSAVNIGKRFLEKNSSSSMPTTSSSNINATKVGMPVARPLSQTPTSHSRLVTTKLTAAPIIPPSTAGWSRPSSAAPSSAATGQNSPNGTSPLPSAAPPATTTSAAAAAAAAAAPQLPHAGKVIQPQPRSVVAHTTTSTKDVSNGKPSNKPVWGNVKPTVTMPLRPDVKGNDFPTAAEVAKGTLPPRKVKDDASPATIAAAASKQARLEEADTFRGVHLDPNAHHWDEMEEDDDNFLGGVIEFGDGRQYKIESTDAVPTSSPPRNISRPQSRTDGSRNRATPVSKEERFVDDFDRSWPRSRTSPAMSTRDIPSVPHGPSSPSISPTNLHGSHSPQDSSRVLFNERSNRLEPYSHTPRPVPNQHQSKRSFQDHSYADTRHPREAGGPHQPHSNVQLLQKPPGDMPSRARGFSGTSSGGFGPSNAFDRNRESRRDVVPTSPRMPRDNFPQHAMTTSTSASGRDRRTTMGPPPVPGHVMRRPSIESGRQAPHIALASQRPPPSRDSKIEPTINTTRPPPQSPALSMASSAMISPSAAPNMALPQLSAPELDEARKDVMQSAAARAKQRRQQEEADREAQKERARQKAAELEAKMKAAEAEIGKHKEAVETDSDIAQVTHTQEKEAISFIEDAVKSVDVKQDDTQVESKSFSRRAPSLKGVPRPHPDSRPPRRLSTSNPNSAPLTGASASPATQTDSWRAKAAPLPGPLPIRQVTSRTPVPSFIPPPSALEQAENMESTEDLEVFDFSDMGKLVGAPEAIQDNSITQPNTNSKASRPVASDFFEGDSLEDVALSKADVGSWRRQVSQDGQGLPSQKIQVLTTAETSLVPASDITTSSEAPSIASTRDTHAADHHSQIVTIPPHLGSSQRTPRHQGPYKEATMSAFDDAISRIKGALNVMQANEASKEGQASNHLEPDSLLSRAAPVSNPAITTLPAKKDRWVPPALRPRDNEHFDSPIEVFLVTRSDPPQSPRLALNKLTVQLPSISYHRDPIHKKQLYSFSRFPFPVRWDILTFEPPVDGMNRRDFSLNDVLFRKPFGGYKGTKFKYRVDLPRTSHSGPKVNIPAGGKPNGIGAFGRQTSADDATTWRKPKAKAELSEIASTEIGLSTTSRSPPPDTLPSESNVTSLPKSPETSPSKAGVQAPLRSRSIPKMPAGSSVAILRDSRIDAVDSDSKSTVNFIMTSELEDGKASNPDPSKEQPSIVVTSPITKPLSDSVSLQQTSGVIFASSPPAEKPLEHGRSSTSTQAESKNSDDSNDRMRLTPPNHHTSWSRSLPVKESPARGPDPEHLKAVWSQTSNKAGFHPVNSLEGIADDFTSLPFTLQDVKSEDGETPPPTISTAPSRMSLHDVTRAFQQVPSSSSSSSGPQRSAISPPSTTAPVARPSSYYSPLPANNMRSNYAPYPSPMMSHSPAPTVMYSHPSPVPGRMPVNGHTPLYSQPLWVAMNPATPQNSGNMMRSMASSPYPAQLMPYPSPGTPAMYHSQANMPPNPSQPPNGVQSSRGRNMSVMSPVMAHAASPMYSGSPVLMHAPLMQVTQNHGFMPVPVGRGQPRADNGQMIGQHPMAANHHPPTHPGYNPVPTSPYARPW